MTEAEAQGFWSSATKIKGLVILRKKRNREEQFSVYLGSPAMSVLDSVYEEPRRLREELNVKATAGRMTVDRRASLDPFGYA